MTLVGTTIKLAVTLSSGGLTMDDFDFVCSFYTTKGAVVEVAKDDMHRESESCYIAAVDTTGMQPGRIRMHVVAEVPDGEVDGEIRREEELVNTDVTISRAM